MAEPTDTYPETATHGGRPRASGDGERALREALDASGEDLAAVLERRDDFEHLLETAVLIVASADEEEIEHLTQSTANLVHAADGLSTEETAALASDVGENAEDLSKALETALALQREGHLDDFATLATAFSDSLSPEEVDDLASLLEDQGGEVVETLDVVLELQREGRLEDLVSLAKTLSTLEVDAETAQGLNAVLGAVGDAQREARPVGLLGLVGQLRSRDGRAGLGYVAALTRALGRRLRPR